MYQETNGGNATKKQDLLLFFGLLALVILARMAVFFSKLWIDFAYD